MTNPVLITFIDCLGPEEAEKCDWLGPMLKGTIESGIPRVTPHIISNILTGKKPPEHGILCPTRYEGTSLSRPLIPTIIEELAENRRVLNYEIPFTMNLNGRWLTNIGSGVAQNQAQRHPFFNLPRAGGEFWTEDPEKVFHGHIDYLRALFGSLRNVIRQGMYDVIFLGIRDVDSFGHFLYKDQRERLIQYIDFELDDTEKMGDIDILFFSDHGIVDKLHTFYINKWLIEQGWLSVDIFEPQLRKHKGLETSDGKRWEMANPLGPFVSVDEEASTFICPDAYDSGIKILKDDAPVDELKKRLMATGMFKGIHTPLELYGDGPYMDELGCDLVCDRADGVLVSCNVHPDLTACIDAQNFCQGNIRTGVHSRQGMWGANSPLEPKDIESHEFYHVIKSLVESRAPTYDESEMYGIKADESPYSEEDEEKVRARLEELGYC